MGHGEAKARLSDECNDKGCSYIDHTGDGQSGDVIYKDKTGDMRKAPYQLTNIGGKKAANIDHDSSKNVVPTVSYDEEADDADHMASMFEAAKLYTTTPIFERFIAQAERDKADSGSFAGKGKSFPILKPGDVKAAVHAMGRAGSGNYGMAALKANIKRIAKSKGWESELPDAWKGEDDSADAKESTSTKVPRGTSEVLFVESGVHFLEEIPLLESATATSYPAVLIKPGRGSSGYYTPEVLQRDGPKIFTAGTHMYWNHPTAQEEAARPEGNMDDLAAVLTGNAYWDENGRDGPALYGNAKPFADYAEKIAQKAPHTGLSIRAYGASESAKKAPDGKPGLVAALTRAESVDFVTRAGAGGKLFTESSKHEEGEDDMAAEDVRKLQESTSRALRLLAVSEARLMVAEELAAVKGFPAAAVAKLKESLTVSVPTTADGELDKKAFKTLVEAGIKAEATYLSEVSGGARVVGLGGAPAKLTEAQQDEADKRTKKEMKEHAKRMGFLTKQGRKVYLEGRAAFDVNYNSADKGILVGAVED